MKYLRYIVFVIAWILCSSRIASAVTFQGTGNASLGHAGGTLSGWTGTIVAGQTLLVAYYISASDGQSTSPVLGNCTSFSPNETWRCYYTSSNAPNTTHVWWRIASAADAAATSFSLVNIPAGSFNGISLLLFTGSDLITPVNESGIGSSASSISGTTWTCPSATAGSVGGLAVCLVSQDDTAAGGFTIATLSGLPGSPWNTIVNFNGGTTPFSASWEWSSRVLGVSAVSGPYSITSNTSDMFVSVNLPINNAASPPTPTPTPSPGTGSFASLGCSSPNEPCIYPPSTVAMLPNCPVTYKACEAVVTDAVTAVYGFTPAGGGNERVPVVYDQNQHAWIVASGDAPQAASPTPTPPMNCTVGLTCDEVGIIANCTGNAGTANVSCTLSQPVYADTVAGSTNYTIHGYTPTAADIGKHLSIGANFGINGHTSPMGAGGNNATFGQPLRVAVANYGANCPGGTAQTLCGSTFAGGSPSAAAVNTVVNGNVELGTSNVAAIQSLVNAGGVLFGAGRMLVDGPIVIPSNRNLICSPGAVFIDPRNDIYNGNTFQQTRGFMFQGTTNASFRGPCTFQGTNVYGPAINLTPNANKQLFVWFSSNIVIGGFAASAPMQILLQTADGSPETYFNSSTNVTSNNNTFTNILSWVSGAFGPSVIQGNGNNLTNNTGVDGACYDNEPNNTAEANLDFSNIFSNSFCISDNKFPGDHSFTGNTTGHTGFTYWGTGQAAGCQTSSTCSTSPGNTWTNNTAVGPVSVVDSGVTSMFKAGSGWMAVPNAQGSPGCDLSPASNCFNK